MYPRDATWETALPVQSPHSNDPGLRKVSPRPGGVLEALDRGRTRFKAFMVSYEMVVSIWTNAEGHHPEGFPKTRNSY
ncbi:hypothetical protein ACVI1I_006369 [Bradyrhizobium sp. USDA 4459]